MREERRGGIDSKFHREGKTWQDLQEQVEVREKKQSWKGIPNERNTEGRMRKKYYWSTV